MEPDSIAGVGYKVESSVSDVEQGSSSPPLKKAKAWYKQPFNPDWERNDDFRLWLRPDPADKYAAKCIVCSTRLANVNKSALVKHANSAKHVRNYETRKSTVHISDGK